MTSQAHNINDLLFFPLQIWKQPDQIKCSDLLRVNKWDADCFEYLQEENTKLSVNATFSNAWIFYYSQLFNDFTEEGRGVMEP